MRSAGCGVRGLERAEKLKWDHGLAAEADQSCGMKARNRACISRYVYRSQVPAGVDLIWGASQKERVDENTGVWRERAPRTPAERLDSGATRGTV